jgi:predicted nuclease with RNAse H fold
MPNSQVANVFVGIDVNQQRPHAYAILNDRGRPVASGWIEHCDAARAAFLRNLKQMAGSRKIHIGIDAPRMPLVSPREHYFERGRWKSRNATQKGSGRHCELVIASLGLAKPQYTSLERHCAEWMCMGFELYRVFGKAGFSTHEVFPSASYAQLAGEDIDFAVHAMSVGRGVKDIVDAHMAAFTVREFILDRGSQVGGKDGLGTIVLPRKVTMGSLVHCWPTS